MRSLPSKLRLLNAHKIFWTVFLIRVDGLAAIQLESLHSATLNLAEKSVLRPLLKVESGVVLVQ